MRGAWGAAFNNAKFGADVISPRKARLLSSPRLVVGNSGPQYLSYFPLPQWPLRRADTRTSEKCSVVGVSLTEIGNEHGQDYFHLPVFSKTTSLPYPSRFHIRP